MGLLPSELKLPSLVQDKRLHMTELGLFFSRSANGVSKLHGDVAQDQFPWKNNIGYITNGVHHSYWMGSEFKILFDRYLPEWRSDPGVLNDVAIIPDHELFEASKIDVYYMSYNIKSY